MHGIQVGYAPSLACRLADLALPVVPQQFGLFPCDATVDDCLGLFLKVLVVDMPAPVGCAGERAGASGKVGNGGCIVARQSSGALGARPLDLALCGGRLGWLTRPCGGSGVWRRFDPSVRAVCGARRV